MKKKKSKSSPAHPTHSDTRKPIVHPTRKTDSTNSTISATLQKLVLLLKVAGPLCFAFLLWTSIFHDTHELAFKVRYSAAKMNMRAILLFISLVFVWLSFASFFRIPLKNRLKNFLLVVYSAVSFFLIFEIVFMYLPISQGSGEAYCMRIWFSKYWELNEQ